MLKWTQEERGKIVCVCIYIYVCVYIYVWYIYIYQYNLKKLNCRENKTIAMSTS